MSVVVVISCCMIGQIAILHKMTIFWLSVSLIGIRTSGISVTNVYCTIDRDVNKVNLSQKNLDCLIASIVKKLHLLHTMCIVESVQFLFEKSKFVFKKSRVLLRLIVYCNNIKNKLHMIHTICIEQLI